MSHPVTGPPTEGDNGERFLSNADLRRRYNKSRMTIHRWQKADYLPAPILIGGKLFRRIPYYLPEVRGAVLRIPK